jgi:hypothetical protein
METIWKYKDTQGVTHITTDIAEAESALHVYGSVLGTLVN